jgi:hypothetical protein
MTPRRVPPIVADRLADLASAVHRHRRTKLDVAIRRTISGMASRGDQVDALVDLVIAWESLFGSRRGEPTLRISAALGWLLGTTLDEREAYRGQAAKIYDLRSDIVHGNRDVPPQEASEALTGARAITLAALAKLFTERTELLAMDTGDDRSRQLIMGP